MIRALCAGLALLSTATVGAQRAAEPLDAVLGAIRDETGVPALAACAVRGREVVAIAAVGIRARGADTPVTVDDRWHLGSCTKAMTATLCGVLVEDGVLGWDTALADAFPELAESMHADFRAVTVDQLLTHRAGLPANPAADGLWRALRAWDGTPREARAHVVEEVLTLPPEHAPGSAFLYSNTGYVIAGAVLERITDRAWEDLIRERVFAPLGITTAGFGPPGTADAVDQPRAHVGRGRGIPPGPIADNPPALGPAGTVHMALRDWARFVALHLGAVDGDAAIVGTDTLRHLHTAIPRDGAAPYACGFGVTDRAWADGPILTHNGSNTMWFAAVWAAPDADFAVLAVTNQGGDAGARATDRACAALIGRFGPKAGGR